MNPILLSLAFGALKGLLLPGPKPQHSFGAYALGPLQEEAMYRAMPFILSGGSVPRGLTAFGFAADHIASEQFSGPRHMLARFADVFAGGMLYEVAYRRYGFLGAVAAHSLHNVGCVVGGRAGK